MPQRKVFADSDSEESDSEFVEKLGTAGAQLGKDTDSFNDNSDDEPPEDVTFTNSKENALQKVRDALSQIGKERDRRKQKRKERNEQFVEQKRLKLKTLESSRLPDDVLQKLQAKPVKKSAESTPAELGEEQEMPGLETSSVTSDSEPTETHEDDFIPLESGEGGVRAVYIMDAMKAPKTSAQKASDFRQQRLYGDQRRRESSREQRARKQKRLARVR